MGKPNDEGLLRFCNSIAESPEEARLFYEYMEERVQRMKEFNEKSLLRKKEVRRLYPYARYFQWSPIDLSGNKEETWNCSWYNIN